MRTTIRMGSFETNSSSTHALVMMRASDVPAWERGELVWDHRNQELVPPADLAGRYPDLLCYDGHDSFIPLVYEGMSSWDRDECAKYAETLNEEHFFALGYCAAWLVSKSELDGISAFSFEASNEL